ncbi:carbamoyltransferase family protein [Haloarcula salinisoli]|uniref:Carbamoyltransferase n=1 Tax=Haloarcula salinisoli TaxID=2487746 RepID=A0A8J7YMK7_9EURY|nr:carbamoyltransferase C-terminal domain-containing protein [Halomicroarcula salinisoli]MBX0288589.1 hypothetical protein [Halomicroarcula salinisoli]MBX0306031.1 hypothetical protein [Halomicroarcula salinisoli]
MADYILSFNPVSAFWDAGHDPSAVIATDDEIAYAIEEERLRREKHAPGTFPIQSIQSCLDAEDITVDDIEKFVIPWEPSLIYRTIDYELYYNLIERDGLRNKLTGLSSVIDDCTGWTVRPKRRPVKRALEEITGTESLPPIEFEPHHRCHAYSAAYPAPFDEGVVLTIDGRGEYDATVVWQYEGGELNRVRTYEYPNSLGYFFSAVTGFLGYRPFNGEGKIMGLAPYGNENEWIEATLREVVETGVDYDVTEIAALTASESIQELESLFNRPRKEQTDSFCQFDKDLAYATQSLLEDIICDIADHYCRELSTGNVAVSGGVALNCKMNKAIRELDTVDEFYAQPVSHDAGLALGACMGDIGDRNAALDSLYLGPRYSNAEIRATLDRIKADYHRPDNLAKHVAERLAEGELVGWFQGRMELGPRALGNRSILADPRTGASRDRVNDHVKHRESWRPFSPSILEPAAETYFQDGQRAPFMIQTFDVAEKHRNKMEAVLHPEDDTLRPQTVTADQNPRYYSLLESFREITGVPALLNTSFNDHGEPIVMTPRQALKDFYAMGLDALVLGNYVLEK